MDRYDIQAIGVAVGLPCLALLGVAAMVTDTDGAILTATTGGIVSVSMYALGYRTGTAKAKKE